MASAKGVKITKDKLNDPGERARRIGSGEELSVSIQTSNPVISFEVGTLVSRVNYSVEVSYGKNNSIMLSPKQRIVEVDKLRLEFPLPQGVVFIQN
ncbi:MAG TPA: hypothetical protein ENI23_00670 [bacterium]|nr:hypothetical protein [bacterium]